MSSDGQKWTLGAPYSKAEGVASFQSSAIPPAPPKPLSDSTVEVQILELLGLEARNIVKAVITLEAGKPIEMKIDLVVP